MVGHFSTGCWARVADRPDEVVRALRAIGADRLDIRERLTWRAWLLGGQGDINAQRRACEELARLNPNNPGLLEQLAELAVRAGQTDQAAALRSRKADVDRALKEYEARMGAGEKLQTADALIEMARLAEKCGRMNDAAGWYRAALRENARLDEARAAIARLKDETADDASVGDLWAAVDKLPSLRPTFEYESTPTEIRTKHPIFVDDAEHSGLRFFHDNGQPADGIRQMPESMCGGVGLLDYDGDGWLDVYCVQAGAFPLDRGSPPTRCADKLFRNRGDGTFDDVTGRAGVAALPGGYGHGVAVGDYDNDGDPDLFISRWRSYALYRNDGGRFADVSTSAGLGGERDWPTSAAFADLDADGDLDLYVCHYLKWDPEHPRLCRDGYSRRAIYCSPLEFDAEPDRLFRNDGGYFTDITAQAGILDNDGRSLGVAAADFDGDGRIDLFVANDKSANFLWRNLGGMRFEEVGQQAGVAGNAQGGYQAGMGIACGDADVDGLLDLAVTNFYGEMTTFYHNLGGGVFVDHTTDIGLEPVIDF